MARLVYALNVSLDGYVDHMAFAPDAELFSHFIEEVSATAGAIYGREMYEAMRYWDDDQEAWGAPETAYATAWRRMPKWVVSTTLDTVGPNATLIDADVADAVRRIKADVDGNIEVAGPMLAGSLTEWGLIDEFQIYLHPVVVGSGKTYFGDHRPSLRLVGHDEMSGGVVRLRYAPA